MAAVNPAVEQLRAAADRLIADGRSEGIEPDGPLGRWLEGQAQALAGLAGLLDDQTLRFEELIGGIRTATDRELQKAAAATELANQAIKAGELTLRQARTAQIALEVEREGLVLRMIRETLPLFADRLKQALVISRAEMEQRPPPAAVCRGGRRGARGLPRRLRTAGMVGVGPARRVRPVPVACTTGAGTLLV